MKPSITLPAAMRLLGVKPGTTRKQLRKAWRRTASQAHPDRNGNPALFRRAHEAYELLLLQPFPLPAPTRSRNGNGQRRSGGRPMEEDKQVWDWEPPAPVSPLTDNLKRAVKDGPQGAAPPPVSLEDALERLPEGADLAVRYRWSATGDPWDADYAVWAAHFPPSTPDGWCVGLEGLDAPGQPEPVVGGYQGRLEPCHRCDAVLVENNRVPVRSTAHDLNAEEGVIYTLA